MKRTIGTILRKNGINAAQYGASSIRGYKPLKKAGYTFLSGYEFCDFIAVKYATKGNSNVKHEEMFKALSDAGLKVELGVDCVKVYK